MIVRRRQYYCPVHNYYLIIYCRGYPPEEDFSMLKLVTKRCKGCGICVNFCPKKVLEVTEIGKCAIIKDKEKDCIKCGQCEMRCPDYAIFVEK